MRAYLLPFWLAAATSVGAQNVTTSPGGSQVGAGNAAAAPDESLGLNQAALAATAAQTQQILDAKEQNRRAQTTFAEQTAQYARTMEAYEGDKAKAAAAAAAYQQQMAAWRSETANRAKLQPKPAARLTAAPESLPQPGAAVRENVFVTAPIKPKRVCIYDTPTGSVAPVRRCRSTPLSEDEKRQAERERENGQTFLDGVRGRAGAEAVRPK